ncbi:hypothetical protein D9M72_468850 [compost metagenome]
MDIASGTAMEKTNRIAMTQPDSWGAVSTGAVGEPSTWIVGVCTTMSLPSASADSFRATFGSILTYRIHAAPRMTRARKPREAQAAARLVLSVEGSRNTRPAYTGMKTETSATVMASDEVIPMSSPRT